MDKISLWKNTLSALQKSGDISELGMSSWIEPLVPLHFSRGELLLSCDNPIGIEMLTKSFRDPIFKAACSVTPSLKKIRFTLEDSAPVPTKPVEEQTVGNKERTQTIPAKQKKMPPFHHPLNQNFTFDRFITAHENSFTYNGATAITENPGEQRFNPLYIYGDTGSGKSHLLHAIGNKIAKERPNFKVLLTTADEFYSNYYSSLPHNNNNESSRIEAFQKTFTNADILLIDDVHHLSGKDSSQLELFKFFNHLHQQKKQIVLTADRPPEELTGIDERLISRLQWGLTVGIQQAHEETRAAIIQEMARKEGLPLLTDVVEFIAHEGPKSPGALEGVIIRFSAYFSVYKEVITLDIAREQLMKPVDASEQTYTVAKILSAVSSYFSIDLSMILGKGRSKEVAHARQMAMYLSKHFTGLSLKQIGLEFGRDHSTVVHADKTIAKKEAMPESSVKDEITAVLAVCRSQR